MLAKLGGGWRTTYMYTMESQEKVDTSIVLAVRTIHSVITALGIRVLGEKITIV